MTSAFFTRRLALLATITSSLVLAACGSGGSSGGQGNLRTLNLTSDLASIDLYLNSTKQFSSQAASVVSAYQAFDAAAYTVNVNSAGNATTLFTGSYSVTKDAHYTAVVWGSQAQLRVTTLPEDDDTTTIAAGNARVRTFNATTETGQVDVFIEVAGTDLSAAAPKQSAPAGGLLGFKETPSGTYQLTVTGAGKPDDIRLQMPITLAAGKSQTLVLTPGSGGVLVNGTLVEQQAGVTALTNTQARVRLVASVDSAGVVAANVSNTLLHPGLLSPRIGAYKLVPAGNVNLSLRVNTVPVLNTPQAVTLTAGADYTFMVYGSAASVQLTTIIDDNRLPLSATRTKIRLVNGVANLDPLALSVDSGAVNASSYVTAGTASTYTQVASNTVGAIIEVDSPTLAAPVYLTTRTNGDPLLPQGVYTVFVLSGAGAPKGTVNPDR
jgi:hypothetical protein